MNKPTNELSLIVPVHNTAQYLDRCVASLLEQTVRDIEVILVDDGSTDGAVFSVKQISPFSSSEFPIVIVGKSPLSAGPVRKQVPLLHPAA